jgi:hypothetical protein
MEPWQLQVAVGNRKDFQHALTTIHYYWPCARRYVTAANLAASKTGAVLALWLQGVCWLPSAGLTAVSVATWESGGEDSQIFLGLNLLL